MIDPTTHLLHTDDGLDLAWYRWSPVVRNDAPSVVLLHGLIGSTAINWELHGVTDGLADAGFEVIALDMRGHGASSAPHSPDAYGEERFALDLAAVLTEANITEATVVGYGMGSTVAAILAESDERIVKVVLGGVGAEVLSVDNARSLTLSKPQAINALTVTNPDEIDAAEARKIRSVADLTGSDPAAIIAVFERRFSRVPDYGAITVPVMVLCGSSDPLTASPHLLAEAIPTATLRVVPGDHFDVLTSRDFLDALIEFAS